MSNAKHNTISYNSDTLKLLTFFEWALALFLVLNGNTVYRANQSMDYPILFICVSLFFVVWIATKFIVREKRFNSYSIIVFVACSFFLIVTGYNIILFFLVYIICFPLLIDYFCLCFRINRIPSLFCKLSQLIVLLTIASLVLWYLGPLTKQISENCEIRILWEHMMTVKGYWWLLFKSQVEDGTYIAYEKVWRNSSIFTEAPMFNLWLCVSLVTELFLRKKMRIFNVIILIGGVASTYSTTGIMCVILLIVLFVYNRIHLLGKKIKIPFVLKLVIIIVGVYYGYILASQVLSMKEESTSYSSRLRDYEMSFSMFRSNPIFGIGFGNQNRNTMGYSNSIVTLLGQGGLWLTLIVYSPIIAGIVKGYRESKYTFIGLALFFIFISTNTVFHNRCVFLLIPALFYAYLKQKKSYE